VFIDEHVCTTLTYAPTDNGLVGLVNIADLLCVEVPEEKRAKAHLPIDRPMFEAAPDEPTLSLDEMRKMDDWQPVHCGTMRPHRKWSHLILVSHKWGHPVRPRTEWKAVREKVEKYVRSMIPYCCGATSLCV